MRSWINLLAYWILVSALGGVVVYATVLPLTAAAMDTFLPSLFPAFIGFAGPLAGALGGAVAGFGQWSALRRRLPRSQSWALITILSWVLGMVLTAAVFAWLLPDGLGFMTLLAPFASGGAIAGLIQERLLRKWVTGRAWWVLASSSGWVLGWILSLGVIALLGQNPRLTPGLTLLTMGAIHGAIIGLQTGFTLIILVAFRPFTPKEGGAQNEE
jgi:hypothetical protein